MGTPQNCKFNLIIVLPPFLWAPGVNPFLTHSNYQLTSSQQLHSLNATAEGCLFTTLKKIQSQSQSYITTDSQSASPSWCQAPIWDQRPIFAELLVWSPL
jgi:hypothetical protein